MIYGHVLSDIKHCSLHMLSSFLLHSPFYLEKRKKNLVSSHQLNATIEIHLVAECVCVCVCSTATFKTFIEDIKFVIEARMDEAILCMVIYGLI